MSSGVDPGGFVPSDTSPVALGDTGKDAARPSGRGHSVV